MLTATSIVKRKVRESRKLEGERAGPKEAEEGGAMNLLRDLEGRGDSEDEYDSDDGYYDDDRRNNELAESAENLKTMDEFVSEVRRRCRGRVSFSQHVSAKSRHSVQPAQGLVEGAAHGQ
jgi:hypothetical protein